MATTILVVEDELEIRELLSFSLGRAGYDVMEADSAEMALNLINTRLPDLIIIDWMLPGISGVELAKRLRELLHPAAADAHRAVSRGRAAVAQKRDGR